MGRPFKTEPKLILDEATLQKIEKLAENLITNDGMASYFKVGLHAWNKFRKKYKYIEEVIQRGNATCIAACTSKLMERAHKGDLRAIIFVLSRQGGWVEKSKEQLAEMPNKAPPVPSSLGTDAVAASKRYLEIMG